MNPAAKWRALIAMSAGLFGATGIGNAQVSFAVQPAGQWNGSSCQSYALAIALAKAKGTSFSNLSARDLRTIEMDLRNEIIAAAKDKANINHDDLKKGFENYTKQEYTISRDRVKGVVALSDRVSKETGVTGQVATPFFLDALVNSVVLTSVTKIDGQGQWPGHIVALLGVDGPPNSTQKMLVVNSGDNKNNPDPRWTCESYLPDKPSNYKAHVAWIPVTSITFRDFGDEYLAWTVSKVKNKP